MASKSVTVWEVNYDTGRTSLLGESVLASRRFASQPEAAAFAETVTTDGRPARARPMQVASRIAESWGMA